MWVPASFFCFVNNWKKPYDITNVELCASPHTIYTQNILFAPKIKKKENLFSFIVKLKA